jgi:hypothetical protein
MGLGLRLSAKGFRRLGELMAGALTKATRDAAAAFQVMGYHMHRNGEQIRYDAAKALGVPVEVRQVQTPTGAVNRVFVERRWGPPCGNI